MRLTKLAVALGLAGASMLTLAAPAGRDPEIKNADAAPMDVMPHGMTPNNMADASLRPLLGLNCRGSSMCDGCSSLNTVLEYALKINDNAKFKNGQKIACGTCPMFGNEAICAFPQKMKKGETVTGAVVKEKLARLRTHGCKGCGSCPIHPGNNVNTGEITVNYVQKSCGHGKCGGVWGEDDGAAVDELGLESTTVEVDERNAESTPVEVDTLASGPTPLEVDTPASEPTLIEVDTLNPLRTTSAPFKRLDIDSA